MKPINQTLRSAVVLFLLLGSMIVNVYCHNATIYGDEILVSPTEKIGYIHLKLDIETTQDVTVHILDMYEKLYVENFLEKEFKTGDHQEILDLTALPSGLYTIQVICGDQEVNQKLIVMSEM